VLGQWPTSSITSDWRAAAAPGAKLPFTGMSAAGGGSRRQRIKPTSLTQRGSRRASRLHSGTVGSDQSAHYQSRRFGPSQSRLVDLDGDDAMALDHNNSASRSAFHVEISRSLEIENEIA
jgi:hypothetical protein